MKKKIAVLFSLALMLAAFFAVSAQAACAHTSTKLVVGKAATCCTAGYKNRVCRSCGAVVKTAYSTISATGNHAAFTSKVSTPATCTKEGKLNVYCKASGKLIAIATIPSEGHSTKSTVTLRPTCISRGKVSIACTRCSFRTSASIPVAPNEHACFQPNENGAALLSSIAVKAATCTSAKCTTEYFPCCGLNVVTYSGSPAAHKYSLAGTASSTGTTSTKRCSTCGAYEEIYTPKAHTSSHRCSPASSTSSNGASTATVSCNSCGYYKKTYTPYIYTSADSYSEYLAIVK